MCFLSLKIVLLRILVTTHHGLRHRLPPRPSPQHFSGTSTMATCTHAHAAFRIGPARWRAGAGRRHDNHHGNHQLQHARPAMEGGIPATTLRGWSFCVLHLPGLSGRALLSGRGLAVWALAVRSRAPALWQSASHIYLFR